MMEGARLSVDIEEIEREPLPAMATGLFYFCGGEVS